MKTHTLNNSVGRSLLLATAFLLALPFSVTADTVRLRNGEEVEGTLQAESFTFSSQAQGKVVVPVQSIKSIRFSNDDAVTLTLVNGQELRGVLEVAEILLDRGLFAGNYALDDIELIIITPRASKTELEKGLRTPLVLAEWVRSSDVEAGQQILFCLDQDLYAGETRVIPRGAPAWGQIGTVQAAAKGSKQGELEIRPRALLSPSGQRIPLTGSADYEGGLDARNFVTMGVLGFLAKGQNIHLPAGTALDAEIASSLEVEVVEDTPESEEWQRCRDYYRFLEAEEVRVEETSLDQGYAPFPKEMTASFPISATPYEQRQSHSLRHLLVFDTYLQNVAVTARESRRWVNLETSWTIVVMPSHDKKVSLRADVVASDEVLCTDLKPAIDAEEKKSRVILMRMKCDREKFEAASAAEELRLRLKLKVSE